MRGDWWPTGPANSISRNETWKSSRTRSSWKPGQSGAGGYDGICYMVAATPRICKMIRLRYDTTIGGVRHGKGSLLHLGPAVEAELLTRGDADTATGIYNRDASGKITGLQGDNGEIIGLKVHPYYHFHGFAGNQVMGDGKFLDLSGINHGVRGANLSDSQMFAVAGFVSTVDPTSVAPDSVIRVPSVNFDYSGGEKLIVWWFGKAT